MKCSLHTDRDAVAQCGECGAGVCAECAQATASLRDNCGTLCVDCYCNEMQSAVGYYAKDKRKRLTRIIVSAILYVLGLLTIIAAVSTGEYIIVALGVVMCGVYTGITWGRASQRQHEEDERKYGATYVITDTGIERKTSWLRNIIFFFIGTIFGVIVTPVRIIVDGVGIKKDKKAINELYAEISRVKML